jgi:ABC-type glycerol-3-phosphate transport system substrate-binding protein
MKHLRLVTLLITSLAVLLLVAAQCAPAATPAPPAEEPQQEAAKEEAAPAGEKVKIVHWSMFSEGEPLQQLLDQATKDFMAENPDIEVEV